MQYGQILQFRTHKRTTFPFNGLLNKINEVHEHDQGMIEYYCTIRDDIPMVKVSR